jgi:hypothetical protein
MSNARDLADLADDATTVPTAAATEPSQPNLIINGGMTVDQRGSTASLGASNGNNFGGPDRFSTYVQGTPQGRVTVSQDTTVLTGSGQSFSRKVDCTTAEAAVATAEIISIQYRIEGQDVQHLMYASSDAVSVTLSFDFRSPKSGTHCVALFAIDDSQHYIKEFTVASADTFEHFEITVALPTSGTAIPDDNTEGFSVCWPMVAGTTWHNTADTWGSGEDYATSNQQNLLDNTANNVYLSNVKLEVGSSATSFEHESYGDTLAKCQRYYWYMGSTGHAYGGFGICTYHSSGWGIMGPVIWPVQMRIVPAVTSSGSFRGTSSGGNITWTSTSMDGGADETHGNLNVYGSTVSVEWTLTANNDTAAEIQFSAEL